MKARRLLVSRSVAFVWAAALTCVLLTAGDAQTTGSDGVTFQQPASAAAESPREGECVSVLGGHGEPVPGYAQDVASESGERARAVMERLALSPALFVENRGQFEEAAIRYLHHGRGALVALTDTGPVIQLQRPGASCGMGILPMSAEGGLNRGRDARATLDRTMETRHVPVHFPGAHAVTPRGANSSSSVYHYQKGAPEHWRENVPTFEEVVYPGLYDGIDLKVWGRRDHLKYEFHVAPGADHKQARVRYEGIRGLSLDADGALLIDLGDGWEPLRDDAPYLYQDIGGERVEIPGHFRLLDAYTYTFELLAPRHPAYPLILDPQVEWDAYLGGSSDDRGHDIAVDGEGNVYVTGYTWSSGWVSGGFDTTRNGLGDAFAMKLSASGAHLWSTFLGGCYEDLGWGIAVDGAGSVYVTGSTESSGWVSGGLDTTHNGTEDGFVVKLSAAGAHLWSTYVGGDYNNECYGIAVDGDGNVYVTGFTSSFGWVSGGFDTTHNGGSDGFVVKLSAAGTHLWSTYLGGSTSEGGSGIAVDGAGNVYVTGDTWSADWVIGGFDTTHNGGSDGFVVKLSAAGAHLWSTYLGGSDLDWGLSIAVDASGDVYVTGDTHSSGWVSGGHETYNGYNDGFVVKLSAVGAHLWSTYLGGSNSDGGFGIAVDGAGSVYVTGSTQSSGWVSGGFDTEHGGGDCWDEYPCADGFIVHLSAAGAHRWSTYLGGTDRDGGFGIAVDGAGNVYVTGYTESSGWLSGGLGTTFNGFRDVFVVKIQDGAGEGEGEGEGATCIDEWHTADQDQNNLIELPELLRVIQFYNSGGFRCADDPGSTEDGYAAGPGANVSCCPHDSDYAPSGPDWKMELTELLRGIQFFNFGGYHYCPNEDPPMEDDFCPGQG